MIRLGQVGSCHQKQMTELFANSLDIKVTGQPLTLVAVLIVSDA